MITTLEALETTETDYSFETIEATANLISDLRLTKNVMDVLERSNVERLFPQVKV